MQKRVRVGKAVETGAQLQERMIARKTIWYDIICFLQPFIYVIDPQGHKLVLAEIDRDNVPVDQFQRERDDFPTDQFQRERY